jgi:hypothetical protein
VESKEIVKSLKEKGRVRIKEGNGRVIEFIVPGSWDENLDSKAGVFLLFDVFQIRSIAEQFSEVSLDIVEFGTKPTIYHTTAGRMLRQGPKDKGIVKFALIRKDDWNKLLFAFGQPLILQYPKSEDANFSTDVFFPLLSSGLKEMYLSPEGDVKIIKS